MHRIRRSSAEARWVREEGRARTSEGDQEVSWLLSSLAVLAGSGIVALLLRRAGFISWAPHSVAVSLAEGWRGEICHVALTDAGGRFAHYKVVDPSFHNWMGLAQALRDQQISDFPLCNKSFNLSYCGRDL